MTYNKNFEKGITINTNEENQVTIALEKYIPKCSFFFISNPPLRCQRTINPPS